jgi:tetratricopeptide (TPR) repeat protein
MKNGQVVKAALVLFAVAFLLPLQGRANSKETTAQEKPSVTPTSTRSMKDLTPEQRGDLLMIHQQYLQAIDAYRQAPRDSAVRWNKLGIAFHHVHALDQAKMDYQQALILQPKYGEAMNNLGAVYYAEKDYKHAEKLYRRALKLMANRATTYSNLGTAYFAEGKFKQGTEAYQAAFALDPAVFNADPLQNIEEWSSAEERARLDFCLAELFAQAGMKVQAIEYLHKAVDAGFRDSNRLKQDEQFASIRHTAEFAQVLAEAKLP